MRQVKITIAVGGGILVLCAIAVAASLVDYVSHPEVANAHVAPVAVTAVPETSDQSTVPPLPQTPVTSVPVQPQPSSAPQQPGQAGAAPAQLQNGALARVLQQLQQHRHPVPRTRGNRLGGPRAPPDARLPIRSSAAPSPSASQTRRRGACRARPRANELALPIEPTTYSWLGASPRAWSSRPV